MRALIPSRKTSLKPAPPPRDLKGLLLVRKPGSIKWSWSQQPVLEVHGFRLSVLQALIGGDVQQYALTSDIALISDKEGKLKQLPPCVSLVTAKGTFTFLGTVALVRISTERMLSLRREDRDFLLSRFKWQVA